MSASALAAVLLAALAGATAPGAPAAGLQRLRRVAGPAAPAPRDAATGGLVRIVARLPWRRRKDAATRRRAVIDLCSSMAAELSAGALPRDALAAAVADHGALGLAPDQGGLGLVADQRGLGLVADQGGLSLVADPGGLGLVASVAGTPHGDIAAALRSASTTPGGDGLRRLEVAWTVCDRSGSGLAFAVGRLVETLRAEERVREEVAAELAGARATGVLLALLPAFGMLMGSALGADPLTVLFATPVGRGCLVGGLMLESAGLAWATHIARAAEPS